MAKKPKPAVPAPGRQKGGYPYYLLPACLKLAQVVCANGGDRATIPKSVVAQGVGMSQTSSAFALLVASTKTFGVVDGGKTLQLTAEGCNYFMPTFSGAKRLAELDFIVKPQAFAFLIKRFDGSLMPDQTILSNLLGRELGIPDSWRHRVAQMFLATTQEFNVVDQGGHLRFAAMKHMAASATGPAQNPTPNDASVAREVPITDPSALLPTPEQQTVKPSAFGAAGNNSNSNGWQYSESGGTVRVETPNPLSRSLWMRLQKYVALIEPENPAQEG